MIKMISEKLPINSKFQIVLTIFSVVCVLLAFNSFHQANSFVGNKFPGFLVYNNLSVSQLTLKDWAQSKYDIKSYDKIIEVDSEYVDNPLQFYKKINTFEKGAEVEYTIQRKNSLIQTTIPIYVFQSYDYLNIFLVQYVVGFIIFLTGIFVYYLKPQLASSKILLLYCLLLGGWFIYDFDNQTTFSISTHINISYLFQIFIPAMLVFLSFYFPEPKKIINRRKWIIALPISYSILLFISQLIYKNNPVIWEILDALLWTSIAVCSLFLIGSLFWGYLNNKNHLYKQKTYVAIIGAFLGFLFPAILAIIFISFGYENLSLVSVPVLFFPLSLGFSIVKHRLFDIDLIVQRTALYGATTAILAGCFIGLVYGLNSVLSEQINWQNPVLVIVFCGLMVVALNPLRDKMQSIVDKMFFRNKYDYRAVVSGVSQELTTILNVDLIASTVVNSINRSMVLEHCELIILNKKTGNYDSYSPGIDNEKPSIPIRSYLLQKNRIIVFLEQDTREIFKEDLFSETVFIGKKDQLLKEFDELNASLVIPVAINESMLGFLSLGNKRSGQPYNSIDLSLLKTLANQAAIAIENSYALKLVESYSDELESKNLHLKDVQSQLVHAEKMSSIGHLASGIAHEIRNPLNIIEGARYYLSNHLESSTNNDTVAKEYLEYIANEIQRTNKLIDELLLFSKPTDSDVSQVNFNKLVDNILILTRKQVNDHSVKIDKVFDPNLPDVYVDSNQIWQVFVNLLINSLESMGKDGRLVIKTGVNHSTDNLNKKSDYAYIIFQDNGHGIKDECLEKIFDPFFTTKASGTGLGLAVGYKIIDSHNGRMLVNSEVGKGTRFMVEIPIESNNIN